MGFFTRKGRPDDGADAGVDGEERTPAPSRGQRARAAAASVMVPKGVGLALGQMGKSRKNLAQALAAARETRARLLNESKLPIKSVILTDGSEHALPADPGERFEYLYEVMGWTPELHKSQVRAVRFTKFASIAMTVVSFALICFLVFKVPLWISIIMVPASLLVLAIGAATTFRWALVEFQYTRRALVDWRTFLVQPDIFRWIFS
ncbi:hypothetical protein [Variovorax gossypii]